MDFYRLARSLELERCTFAFRRFALSVRDGLPDFPVAPDFLFCSMAASYPAPEFQ